MLSFISPEIVIGGLFGSLATPVVLVVGMWEFFVKRK